MKELQNIIHRHFEDPKQKKRYLAVLIALSMLVSFMVPLILTEPADSITKNKFRASSAEGEVNNRPSNLGASISGTMLDNYAGESANVVDGYTYSPEQMDLFTLLFGAGVNSEGELIPLKWYTDDNGNVLSLDAALEAAASEYFLGFANDFCAFIEGDFTATDADAEGRVFVGGDLKFDSNTNKWNYQVGSGDFGNFLPMNQTEEYNGMFGYASAIVGGKLFRIGTLSTGHTDWINRNPNQYDRHINDKTPFYHPEEGLYKSFIVGDIENSLHYRHDSNSDIQYTNDFKECMHDYPGDCSSCSHTYLEETNEQAQLYSYDNVSYILEKTFNTLRMRSTSLGTIKSQNAPKDESTIKLDLTNAGDAKTVYYNIPSWDNISRIDIIVPNEKLKSGTSIYTANENDKTFTELGYNIVFNCGDPDISLYNVDVYIYDKDKTIAPDGIEITNKGDASNNRKYTNNHPLSSNFLFNFYNANKVHINDNTNFLGTILAPNAAVTSSEVCPGHLSGALIAKSFEGGLEFGYRPYRGGNDILGMASGYEVPVEKLIAGTDKNLAGAMFAIKEGSNVISLFESINGVNYVAIPSDVDFTGNTVYMPESIVTGPATKDTTSNVSVNTNLVKPLIVTAYDSSGNEITWNSESVIGNFNIGTTVVLKANQPVDWIQKVYNDTVNFTTNDDNSLTLKINKPIENNEAYNFNVKIKGIDSSEKSLYLNVNPVTITASPTEYNVGDEMKLSVSGISENVTVKYKYENTSDYIVLDDNSSFVTDRIGDNKIIAELYQGESKLYETSVSVKGVSPDENMKLTISADSYIVGQENIVLSLTGAPSTATIKFYFEDMNNPKQNTTPNSCTIENPTKLGDVAVKAEVWYKNSYNAANTYTGTVKGVLPEMSIAVSPENCVVNNNITLSVLAAPQNNTQISYEVKGPNNFYTPNSSFTPETVGTYTVTAKVVYNGDNNNAVTLTKEIIVNNAEDNSGGTDETTGENNEATESNTEQTTLSTYSIRKGVNRLSTESEQESIEITAHDGKTIKSIKLYTDLINNNTNYSLDVKFYDANNVQKGDTATVDYNNKDNAIKCPDGEAITKIVVEAALGAVKVESYDVTYTEPCKSVTRTAPFNLQTNSENSYVIDTDVFRDLVASDSSDIKLTDYDSITFTLSSNAAASNTGVKYWLYKDAQEVEYSDKKIFESGSFTINDLSSRGITKIVIRAKDDTALPIVSYSIVSLTATDTEPKPVNNMKEIEHTYVIEEIEAPHGFFPTTDKYEVKVVETFDLKNISVVNGKYYPNSVDTVITVNKITKNSDGTESETSVYETKLCIKYGNDTNTRIIEVMNGDDVVDTFTIVKKSDALTGINQIESVSHNNTSLGIDLTKAGIIEDGENKYYFNPDTMMIVPMPENNIEFENTPGLLFKKVDERGYAVTGVTIYLTPEKNKQGESLWSWDSNTSEKLIDVSKLDVGDVYCFSEDPDTGGKYEKANDIFFKVVNNDGVKTIRYGATADDLDEEGKYQTLDLINNREIRMVDMRIVGVELEINKVDESGKPLKGAVFDLYADADEAVLLKSDITVDNNGKATVNLADVDNSTYVENGYLKPGNYYLIETVIPEHLTDSSNKWYEDPGKIKFRVNDDFTVEYINEQTGGNTGGSENTGNGLSAVNRNDNKQIADVFMSDGSALNISNVTGVEIVVESWNATPTIQIYIADFPMINSGFEKSPGSMNNSSYFKYNDTNLNISTLAKVEIQNWTDDNVVVRYVKITTSDNGDYIFCDPSYTPPSAASLEDETAVVDETGENTEGETGENTGEDTPAVERELLEVSDGENGVKVLTVTNKEDDNERDVNVEKRWTGDTGFEELRPDVTFTLYQSETEITDRSQLTPEMIYKITNGEGNKVPYTITITEPDANGKWTGKFTGLPTKYLSNGEYVDYHYYIVETQVDGYSIKDYSKDTDGTLVVENELVPVSVKATKEWSAPTGIGTKPESITLQLQVKIGNTWTNVEGKTLTLTADNASSTQSEWWVGEFTGLVKGKEYRLTESSVNGWEVESNPESVVNGASTENLTITNKPKEVEKGSLSISKAWQNAQGGELTTPNVSEVYVQLYRKVNKLWPVGQPLLRSQGANSVQDDYARLLQYSLYFYDGLMCGDQVDENSAYSWRDECHTYESVTVPGGYHDAGDHVMFGLPAGFSASSLGWSLYEFRDEYDELGQTAHTKVITDYYADFFSRCIRDNNGTKEILVQKGHGNTDHAYWGIPEGQPEEKWGQAEYWVSGTGADIAAEYAAALALSYLNFYDPSKPADDSENVKYKGYLDKAKEFYAYAEANPHCLNEWGVNLDETQQEAQYPGFYKSDDHNDDMAWAAGWIALALKDTDEYQTYKSKLDSKMNNLGIGWGGYNWNNVCLGAHIVNAAYHGGSWDKVRDALTSDTEEKANANGGATSDYKDINDWGCSRYNTGFQTFALVAAKHQDNGANVGINEDNVAAWAQSQMDFILGGNGTGGQEGICLITNFTDNSVKRPHFRAGSGQVFDMAEKDDETIIDSYDDKNRILGGLVGGPRDYTSNYEDRRSDYQLNEVASDYNANLVGAAAGLYYFYRTGELYEIPGVKVQYLPDEEPETQAEETPAPQAEEQQQSNNNSINTVYTQAENSSTTASETVSSEQNSSETNTETGENSAQVAKLSSRFSNAFSILSVGFSRLATETVETHNLLTIVWNTDAKPNCSLDSVTFFYYDSSTGNITSQTLNNVQASENQWWHEWNLQNIPRQNFVGISIESSGPQGGKALIVVDEWEDNSTYRKAVNVPDSGTVTWGTVIESNEPKINTRYSTIAVGDKLTLTYTGENPQWSVDRTDLADISNGELTAKAAGTVTVSANEATKVITIENLNIGGNQTMTKGQSQTLTINSINGLNGLSWTSSDTNVATVSNGVVNAQNVGSTVITATNNGITATFNITVNENSGGSTGGVTTPNGYVLVHTENINELYATKTIYSSTPAELNGITVDYIIVEFSSNSNETYNGAFYINGTEESFTTDSNDNKKYKVQNNILSIPIQNGVNINTLSVNCWWNGQNGNVARLENIYFYRLKADPTIVEITDEFRVGDEPITLTATDFDGVVEWSIVSGSEYAEIDPNTGVLTAKGAGTVTVKAVYGDQEATADITIKPFELTYQSGEDEKEFKVHAGTNSTFIDLNAPGAVFTYTSDNVTIGADYSITVADTAAADETVSFTASLNGDSINGTIKVIPPLAIEAEGGDNENKKILIYSNKPQQFTAANKVGTVQWSVSGDGIATISENGLLTPTGAGNVTVTATDADGTTATYDVTIQLGSALVDITGMEPVGGIITISSENGWKASVADLPVVDANGDYYSYYIVECDKNGNVIENSNPIRGTDGSMYIPISYENGEMLNTGSPTELSVSNRYSGKTQGQMPSSGGVGRTTYYFFGGMIMLLSAAGYTCTRRRQSSRRAK